MQKGMVATMNNNGKLGLKERFGMALGYAGGVPLFIFISAYLVYFYTNVVGLDAGIIGTLLLVSKVFDGVSDIFFGNIIDKTRTKLGVCRPWVIRMSFFSLVGLVVLFAVPPVGDTVKYIFAFISYNVANTIIYTILQLSIISLPTYMTRDSEDRSKIYVWANTGQFIMQFAISSVMFKVVEALGGTQMSWIMAAAGVGVIGMLLLLVMAYLCKENVDPDEAAAQSGGEAKVPLPTVLKAIIRNQYWWEVLGFVILGAGVYATTVTMTPYYSQYILLDTKIADTLNACYTFPMMIAAPFFLILLPHFSKRNIALMGVGVQTLGTILIMLFPTNMMVLYIGAVMKSVGFSAPTSVYMAMLSDAIEYGQWKTGIRSQAVMMGANSTGQKIGAGVVSAILGWVLSANGFDGMLEVQSTAANSAISNLYMLLPVALSALMIVILFLYDLDKKYPQIMKELEERGKEGAQ